MNYAITVNTHKIIIADTVSDPNNIGWLIRFANPDNPSIVHEEIVELRVVLRDTSASQKKEIIEAHKAMIEEAEDSYNKQQLISELEESLNNNEQNEKTKQTRKRIQTKQRKKNRLGNNNHNANSNINHNSYLLKGQTMSKDITTTNQEKIDQIEKYLSRNPEQKINDKGLYRISIKLPNSSSEDIYHIAGFMLVDWLRRQTDYHYTYTKNATGEITHASYYVGNACYPENERIRPIDEAPTLYEVAIDYLLDDRRLDIKEVEEKLVIHRDSPTITFDGSLRSFAVSKDADFNTVKSATIEDVINEIASDKESATEIYDKCKHIINTIDLSDYVKDELEIELEEAAEYIEEYYQ